MYKKYFTTCSHLINILFSQNFNIARIQYGGGGDWYSDPSSLPNLLQYLKDHTSMKQAGNEIRIKLTDNNAHHFLIIMTGHGNINLSDDEVIALRTILLNGGFLHADDNYGMDASFRREMKKVFPNKDLLNCA